MSATPATARPDHSDSAGMTRVSMALGVDAVSSAGLGAALALGNSPLAEPLGIPSGWLLGLGLFLVAYGADLALVASRPRWHRLTRAIAVGNAGWVAASIILVLAGGFDLTALGTAVVLGQAAIVAMFAVLQSRASPA